MSGLAKGLTEDQVLRRVVEKVCEQVWSQDETAIKEALAQPAQRTWVGLTDGVMCDIAIKHGLMSIDWIDFAQAIEQALKEKNFD
jgi:hypothetical protein